jgi:hypothetical protein
MGYSPFKMAPKSPLMKNLVGNQGKLPQQLQDAIKAAPESPAKQTKKTNYKKAETFQDYKSAASAFSDFNPKSDTVFTAQSLDPGSAQRTASRKGIISAEKGASKQLPVHDKMYKSKNASGQTVYTSVQKYSKSPAKQTTANEFAYEKSLKDKNMGKSTKVVDKFTSALEAPFSDKTYSELKKEKRAKQKAKYNAKK